MVFPRRPRWMEEGFGGVWCQAGFRSREGKPLYVDANGQPVQALGPPTTCRQNTLRGALGSRPWRKRPVPLRQFAPLSCLPTPVLSEVGNKAVWFALLVGRDKSEPGFLRRN